MTSNHSTENHKPDEEGPKRAFGYIRASLARQKNSPEMQRRDIERFVETRNNLELIECVEDKGVSGKIEFLKRPGARRLIELVQEGDHVIFHKVDRAGRDLRDVLTTLEWFNDREITVHFLDMGGQEYSPHLGKLIVAVRALMAEFENKLRSERAQESAAYRRENGLPNNGNPKYGYRYVKRRGRQPAKYIFDPEEAKFIHTMDRWNREEGLSYKDIENRCRRRKEKRANGGPWRKTAIFYAVQKLREAREQGLVY